jgi:hypothetical protein
VIVEPDCGKVGELGVTRHVDGEDHLVSYRARLHHVRGDQAPAFSRNGAHTSQSCGRNLKTIEGTMV